ncbi:hypothetical protein PR202_ga24808 [Eleusine coracana subsp. coracana]|uniref:Secreted protein n=1 Tax=Eleusine coracana subsp. coracana TaxID=191504 RepID=A0AAV5D9X8_ELECO|nr:hypothetical protein PR202_ga24808 [Eleusine coracana subsp. coracana]
MNIANGLQGHLNPARTLVRCLALVPSVACITLSETATAHSHMFPSSSPLSSFDDKEASDSLISYIFFSDGIPPIHRELASIGCGQFF